MRAGDTCPACGEKFGRSETVVRDQRTLTIYWHEELTDSWVYCAEYPCGDLETHQDHVEARCAGAVGD